MAALGPLVGVAPFMVREIATPSARLCRALLANLEEIAIHRGPNKSKIQVTPVAQTKLPHTVPLGSKVRRSGKSTVKQQQKVVAGLWNNANARAPFPSVPKHPILMQVKTKCSLSLPL